MTDILLNYAMPIKKITPMIGADLTFLHKALVICKPKGEAQTEVKECVSEEEVKALTDAKCYEMLNGGMSSIYVLAVSSLDITTISNLKNFQYYTVIIDEAFTSTEVEARKLGDFKGVVGYMNTNRTFIKGFNVEQWNAGFYGKVQNGAVNMYRAFGELLSGYTWRNQQYIEMPENDGVVDLNDAEVAFEDKVNFVLNSPRYGNRLALFSAGNKAIVAPYIYEEASNNIQGWGVQYININNPDYTIKDAKLMQEFIQNKLNVNYVNKGLMPSATCEITIDENSNFVASGVFVFGEPKALWRVKSTVQQGEI